MIFHNFRVIYLLIPIDSGAFLSLVCVSVFLDLKSSEQTRSIVEFCRKVIAPPLPLHHKYLQTIKLTAVFNAQPILDFALYAVLIDWAGFFPEV